MTTGTAARRSRGPHPKVAARREAVHRARGRRRARVAGALLVAFSLAGLGWLVVHSGLLDVDTVEVRGSHHTAPDDVRKAAAIDPGEALLLVDRGAVARRVERLPWVADATVERSLPGTLRITVREREPSVWLAAGDEGVAIVDGEGWVLDVRPAPPEGVPELRIELAVPSPGERLEDGADGAALVATAPPGLRPRVTAVERDAAGWVLRMTGVDVVQFGPPTDVARKWAALEAVLDRIGDRRVYLVDVRVPSVPAVRELEQPPAEEPGEAPPEGA